MHFGLPVYSEITSLLWQVVRLLLDKRADIEAKEKFVSLESQRSRDFN